MANYTFEKQERLKRFGVIKTLFEQGDSLGVYPVRMVWLELEQGYLPHYCQTAFAVGRRYFKKSTQRNRIRRLLREAWRLNKPRLLESLENSGKDWAFMLIYTGKEEMPFRSIEKAVEKLIDRFLKQMERRG